MKTTSNSTNNFGNVSTGSHLLKRTVVAIFLFAGWFASPLYAQQYHYRFQLQGITDDAGAKMVTDVIRPVFNTPDDPYKAFPDFDDQLDEFDFRSDVLVTKEQLESALLPNGIIVTGFSSTEKAEQTPEKR